MWPTTRKYKLSSSPIYPMIAHHCTPHCTRKTKLLHFTMDIKTLLMHLNLPKNIISLPRTTSFLCKDWKHWYAPRRFLCNDTMWKRWVGSHAQEDLKHLHPITLSTIIGQTILLMRFPLQPHDYQKKIVFVC